MSTDVHETASGSVTIGEATRRYEAWLGRQTPLLPADLDLKHQRMKEDGFAFLRATFYRRIQAWLAAVPTCSRSSTPRGWDAWRHEGKPAGP